MKLHYFLGLVCFILLQSCQHPDKTEEEHLPREPKPTEAAAYNSQLGLAYLKQGNRSLAKHKLLLALSQDPNSANANAAMAYFLEKTGELDKAQIYYQKAMATAPKAGTQLNNYGAFLCRRGSYAQAETYFMKAVNDIEYEHTAGAYENAGLCALAIPNNDKAKFYFNKALEQDPEREQSLYELVKLEVKQGHLNDALTYFQKYPNLALRNKILLTMAVDVAHQAGKPEIETNYKMHLQNFSENTGEKK